MDRINLIYDYQIFSHQKYGGVSRYICELARRVVLREEFTTRILAFFYVNEYLKSLNSRAVVGQSIPFIPKTRRLRLGLNQAIAQLYPITGASTIVHETYYAPYRTSSKTSKVVLTVHDLIHEKFSHLFPAVDHTSAYKAAAIRRADRIICVSQNTRKDLLEYFDLDPQIITVIPLGCSLAPAASSQRRMLEQPYLLYVGDRQGYKNFAALLTAYAHSKDLNQDFVLVCFGSSPFSPLELELIASFQLSPQQVRHVPGNEHDLADWYRGAAALIFPSLYEGFGIPVLEAMTCGCPVICSDTSSLPEVAGQAAEYFDPYQWESLEMAISTVVYSATRREMLVAAGRQRAQHFSWDKCAEATSVVYRSLL